MNLNNSRLLKKIIYYNHTLFCTVLGEMNGFLCTWKSDDYNVF